MLKENTKMKRLNKGEHTLVLGVLNHFLLQANKAIREYATAGVDETHPLCGKSFKYYQHAAKYIQYMIWNIDPNKKQKRRKVSNAENNNL